jgi:hypothetical protein
LVVTAVLVLFLVSISCAPGNTRFEEKPAGFFAGLWHGLICVITFVIGLFTDKVSMYEVSNSGNWYDFGFLLGAACALGGSGAGSRKKKKRC